MIYFDDVLVESYEQLHALFHQEYDNDEAHVQAMMVWGHDNAFSPDQHIWIFQRTSFEDHIFNEGDLP